MHHRGTDDGPCIETRPSVPTARVCERFDELRTLLAALADSQKMLAGPPSAPTSRSESSSRRPSRPPTPGIGAAETVPTVLVNGNGETVCTLLILTRPP